MYPSVGKPLTLNTSSLSDHSSYLDWSLCFLIPVYLEMVFRVKWKKLKGKKNSPLREERKTWWMNRLTHPLRFILPAASLSSSFRCLKEPSPTCEKKWPLFLLGASAQLIPYKHLLFITLEGQGGRSPSTLFFIILDCEVKNKKIASPYFFSNSWLWK